MPAQAETRRPGATDDETAGAGRPTRERLLLAARGVIERGGYGGASVLAIAEAAGVASGTLYRHFPSKAELFVEVFREVCGHELEAATTAAEQATPRGPAAAIDALIATFAQRALATPTLAWALIAEPVDPAVEAVRLEFRAAYRELVAQRLRDAITRSAAPPQDADLTAAALVGAANEILAGPLAPARQRDRDAAEVVLALRRLWARTAGLPTN